MRLPVGRRPEPELVVVFLVRLLVGQLAFVEPPLTVVASEGRLGRQGDLIGTLAAVIQPGMKFLVSHVVVSWLWADRHQPRPPRRTALAVQVLKPLPALLGQGIAEARIPTGARACQEARAIGPEQGHGRRFGVHAQRFGDVTRIGLALIRHHAEDADLHRVTSGRAGWWACVASALCAAPGTKSIAIAVDSKKKTEQRSIAAQSHTA